VETPGDGLRVAIELTELGGRVREQRFRREHPRATEVEVAEFMQAWWLERPGAPAGDYTP
jgi:hypothetical protein